MQQLIYCIKFAALIRAQCSFTQMGPSGCRMDPVTESDIVINRLQAAAATCHWM